MTPAQLLTKVFFDMGNTHKHIVYYYEKEGVDILNLEKFIDVCRKYNILNHPVILFDFLDTMDIKVAIFPVIKSQDWAYRIYHGKDVVISNDFSSRTEATIFGLEAALFIYCSKIYNASIN